MAISFSALGRHGRLGNQLFQLASTLGLAEKYGATAAFPEWEYEPYFETPIPHGERQMPRIAERYFHHYDWELTDSCDLYGYMQSEKYFGSTRLKLKESFVEECKAKYDIFQRETICIQIRRGDYVGNENYHQLTPNYYFNALLAHFQNWRDCNILFISDDIEYCRTHFECLPNATFSMGSDIQDLALASACDHFIISNSSFGWWSAWLGEKKHSKIVHCGKLHAGDLKSKDIQDYYPKRWIMHERKSYKLQLKDATFTIPVLYDHKDRKDNFDMSLFILQTNFDTNFIVCEQGGDKFSHAAQWGKYMQSEAKHFHRTQMLNQMCYEADTQFIVNWDCDVIIPPVQIYMAVERLRLGADMVFPYDGRFARMRRNEWMPQLQGNPDIGIVGATMFKGREPEHLSVGGAVMFNREAFMDGGMENENMISFGPEDNERVERFRKLNYDIQRVGGSLFHMSHHVGPNSSPENPYWPANNAEFEKIKAMDAGGLREYVSTWEWVNQYSSRYYGEISEGAIRSAKIVMAALPFEPESVIDIGCGVGEWNNGHPDYTGVDYRILQSRLLIPPERYIECDLNREIVPAVRKYDLCLCLEVAEHLRTHRAGFLVEMLCNLSDRVLFSAAIPFQGGNGHCLTGDTIVSGPLATHSFSRYYEGIILELTFASGNFLSITPNHPVLTPDGWVSSDLLKEGCYVIRCADNHRVSLMIPNDYQVPALIKDVADSLGVSGSMRTPGVKLSPKDFYGERKASKVDIVGTDSLLREHINSEIKQPFLQNRLGQSDMGFGLFPHQSSFTQGLKTSFTPFHSTNKSVNDSLSPLGASSFSGDPRHLGSSPEADSVLEKDIPDGIMTAIAKDPGKFLGSFPGLVELDKLVNIRIRDGRHYVYNLSTKPEWYLANSIIVHNCNEQWQTYWAGLFKLHGFGAAERQPDIRNNPDVELWYRQNMVLYERGGTGTVVDFVLPEYYMGIAGYLNGRIYEKK